jgi:hypothetical protein
MFFPENASLNPDRFSDILELSQPSCLGCALSGVHKTFMHLSRDLLERQEYIAVIKVESRISRYQRPEISIPLIRRAIIRCTALLISRHLPIRLFSRPAWRPYFALLH